MCVRAAPAFTLTELMIVIAIIAVLFLLSVVAVRRMTESARGVTAVGNLKQLALANLSYASDNGGRIVGLGNGIDYKGQSTRGMGLVGRLYPYISGSGKLPSWGDLHSTFAPLRDPNVPTAISDPPATGTYRKTWASNHYFAEYPGPNTEGRLVAGKRLQAIDRPEKLIYLISGYNFANAAMATDPAMVEMPKSPRNGIYYSCKGKAPAAFLDGHGELLSFPIDPRMFDPNHGSNP